jgi:hypothetical protein
MENGTTKSIKTPSETTYFYSIDGLIDHTIDKNCKTTIYTYKNGETILISDDEECRYDSSSGRIKRVVLKAGANAGRTIEYCKVGICGITESDSSQFIFYPKQVGDSIFEMTLSEYIDKNGLKARYDDNGALISIEKGGHRVTEAEIHGLEHTISDLNLDLEIATGDRIDKETVLSAKQTLLDEARNAQEAAYAVYLNAQKAYSSALSNLYYAEQRLRQSSPGYNVIMRLMQRRFFPR